MKTRESLYGKITIELPHGCGHTVTYYILCSDTEIDGDVVYVYGLKAEETDKNGSEIRSKKILDISQSRSAVELMAKVMLVEFVTLTFFEDVIEDFVEDIPA